MVSDAIKDACLELDEHGIVVLRSPLEVRAAQTAYPGKTQVVFSNGWWTVRVITKSIKEGSANAENA